MIRAGPSISADARGTSSGSSSSSTQVTERFGGPPDPDQLNSPAAGCRTPGTYGCAETAENEHAAKR